MSTDYKPAQWIPTSHYWAGRGGHAPRWIIIHGTAGGTSAQAVAYYFQTDDPPTSAHYVVGLEGEIVQCVAEANSAWANGVVTQGHDPWWSPNLNPNFLTFSIEHVKPATDNSSQLTEKQKQASFALIEHLCDTYNIPKREADANGGITGHYSIDPVNRSRCPGTFPWEDLWTYLSGGGNPMGVPAGWKDDGTTLSAPNGKRVVNGFRWYVLNNGWDPNNWPLESEYYEQVIDVTNPKLGSGTVQHFRKSILAWQEGTSDVLDLWSGAIAQTWQQRALACETSHSGVSTTPPQPAAIQAAPVVTTKSANAPDRTPAPMGYIPPLSAMQRQPNAAPARSATAAATGGGSNGQDPIGDRISSLEQQIQSLLDGVNANSKTRNVASSLTKDLETAASDLANPKVRRTLFGNPKSLLRWVLMIVGLLLSDGVAWAVSTFLHHSTTLPVPFLTLGTVLMSGLVFLGTIFKVSPIKH